MSILCLSMIDNGDFVTLDFVKRVVRPMCDYGGLVFVLFQFIAQYLSISFEAHGALDDQMAGELREMAFELVESVLERNDYEDAE